MPRIQNVLRIAGRLAAPKIKSATTAFQSAIKPVVVRINAPVARAIESVLKPPKKINDMGGVGGRSYGPRPKTNVKQFVTQELIPGALTVGYHALKYPSSLDRRINRRINQVAMKLVDAYNQDPVTQRAWRAAIEIAAKSDYQKFSPWKKRKFAIVDHPDEAIITEMRPFQGERDPYRAAILRHQARIQQPTTNVTSPIRRTTNKTSQFLDAVAVNNARVGNIIYPEYIRAAQRRASGRTNTAEAKKEIQRLIDPEQNPSINSYKDLRNTIKNTGKAIGVGALGYLGYNLNKRDASVKKKSPIIRTNKYH
jgi:hypothetical protein